LLRLRLLLLLLRACGTSCSQDIQDSVAVLLFFPPLLHLLLKVCIFDIFLLLVVVGLEVGVVVRWR